jgi:tetratricopeptide (TPR) repeat protein
LGLLLAIWFGGQAPAETPPPPSTPEGTLSFANSLLHGGESFRAATEFGRFLHHFPGHPATGDALEGLGRAFASAGRYGEAANTFRRLLREDTRDGKAAETRWLLGSALYQDKQYAEAAATLLAEESSGPAADATAVLGTLALLRGDPAAKLPPTARRDLAESYRNLPSKSPALAGTLSALLPGAGHFYCDRPRDGTVSFLLNGVFLWGTYAAVKREEWALAGVLGFFELGWYSGNIVSSANAAHKWNRREQGRLLREWEGISLPQWHLALRDGEVGATLSWRW